MTEFKPGDVVKLIGKGHDIPVGSILTVVEDNDATESFFDESAMTIELRAVKLWPSDFEFVGKSFVESESIARDDNTLGIYRPNLEDRKIGKVRVELVDDGFPLALREIAKVMTWAQTAKGYKDHDWQNLPNPEQSLSGATSRHRSDNIIQRMVEEKPALECVDHESLILHKAHEAFGVLAQLELILRGVIK